MFGTRADADILARYEVRPLKPALFRGMCWRCPRCGEGKLFCSYLKVVKACPHRGEDLSHQRADDSPTYITMLIICHIADFMIHILMTDTDLSSLTVGGIVVATVLPLPFLILPSAKGFLVAMQWAEHMHGFGKSSAPQG